jgi:hypothetical protein
LDEVSSSDQRGNNLNNGNALAFHHKIRWNLGWTDRRMIIRQEQMTTMRDALTARFVEQSLERIRTRFPERSAASGLDSSQWRAHLERAVSEARERGISGGDELDLYLDCLVLIGPAFPADSPWALEILDRSDIDGPAKMMQINDYLIFGMDEPL